MDTNNVLICRTFYALPGKLNVLNVPFPLKSGHTPQEFILARLADRD